MSTLHCIHAKDKKTELSLDTIQITAIIIYHWRIEYALTLRSVVTPPEKKVLAENAVVHSTGLKFAPMKQNEYCKLHFFLPKVKVSS